MSLIELAQVMLVHCRMRKKELVQTLDSAFARQHYLELRRKAATFFQKIDGEHLDQEDLRELRINMFGAIEPQQSADMVVRAYVVGLDAALGHRFAGMFKGRELALGPNEAFPIVRPPLKDIFKDELNSNPDRLSDEVDAIPNLRLAPVDFGSLAVHLSWVEDDALAAVSDPRSVAVAIPNLGIGDFDLNRYQQEQEHVFFNVRPRDSKRQQERMTALVKMAREREADILVLPELCATHEIQQEMAQIYRQGRRLLTIAGTHHAVGPDQQRRNLATVAFPSGRNIHLHKISEFSFRDDEVTRREDIHTMPRRIVVHYSGAWSIVTLICKDFIDPGIARMLADLQVRLVVVTAFSDITHGFEGHASSLSVDAQSMVLIGNNASADPSRNPAFALLVRPTVRDSSIAVRHNLLKEPALVSIEVATGKLTITRLDT